MNSLTLSCFVVAVLSVVSARPHEEHHPRPYKFSYGVSDHHTGDHHQQHEESDGHIVRGSYSLREADGSTRIVDYIAGPHIGFIANVRRIGQPHHPQEQQWGGQNQGQLGGLEEQRGFGGGEELSLVGLAREEEAAEGEEELENRGGYLAGGEEGNQGSYQEEEERGEERLAPWR